MSIRSGDTTFDSLEFRRAVPADAAALAALRYTFRGSLGQAVEGQEAFVARCTDWMHERLAGSAWLAWLASGPGDLAGSIWLQPVEKIPNPVVESELHAYITNFYVTPEQRGTARKLTHQNAAKATAICHPR